MRWMTLALVAFAFAAPAMATQYTCRPTKESGQEQVEKLTVNGNRAVLHGAKLTLDATYKPRLNKDYFRFGGYRGEFNNDGYGIDVLLHKDLVAGKSKGWMKIVARGEGYFNYSYFCFQTK